MKLIVNADDFGLSKGVNLGIVEAFKNGIVRSATIMANMPAFEHALILSKRNSSLHVGVHLNLTTGKSLVSGLKTLTDENGYFFEYAKFLSSLDNIDPVEVRREYTAQIERVVSAGIEITHFEGHHHTQALPGVREIFIELCRKHDVPARSLDEISKALRENKIPTTEKFTTAFYGDGAKSDLLIELLEANKNAESLEIMCHPAYLDSELYHASSYNITRIFELEILTSAAVKEYIRANQIELCGYCDIL